jgi:hypothetical protein
MNTEQLIDSLAATVAPAPARRLTRRLLAALAAGGIAGLLLVTGWFGLDGLFGLVARPYFWLRLGLLAGLVWVLSGLAEDVSRPGARPRLRRVLVISGIMAALSLVQLGLSPAARWPGLVMGSSWAACPYRVVAIALCALPFVFLALRSGAPTQPWRAGAAAGALSGALGATLYALFCREPGLAFVVLWYGAGVAATAGLGAILGPILLRWRDPALTP